MFVVFAGKVFAQRDTIAIRPFVASVPTKIWTDQYLYVGTNWASYGYLNTANNNYNTIKDTLGHTSFEIGLQWNFQLISFKRGVDNITLSEMYMNSNELAINIGYAFVKYSTPQDRWGDAGIHSHWLSFETSVYGFRFFVLGIQGSIYLGSTTKSPDGWKYNGFNSDCFNHFTINPTMGVRIRYTNVFMEIRVGLDSQSKINRRKMAYYNAVSSVMLPTTDIYLVVRLGFRNFTTAKKTR